MTKDISKLIGIKFAINREDFNACDCVGICWLYHNYVHGKDYPHRDGDDLKFRDRRKDAYRIKRVIETWASEVKFDDLIEGDIVLLKCDKDIGGLGVMINRDQMLYMNEIYGSSLLRREHVKKLFITAYRANQ